MEWAQFITLMATMIGGVFAFHKMTQDSIHKMDERHREYTQKHDIEMQEMKAELKHDRQEMREEISKRDALWARLLEKIHIVEKQIYNLDKKFYKISLERSKK